MNDLKKYLPLGSVVMLKNGQHRVMINGYCAKTEEREELFDYIGCMYPEGIFTLDSAMVFDHDDIKEVIFMGLADDEFKAFEKKLKELVNKEG